MKRCPVCNAELVTKHYEDDGDWLVCQSCGKSRQPYILNEPWENMAPWKREAALRNALAAAGHALETVYRAAEMITDNLKHVDGPGKGMIEMHAEDQRVNIAPRLDEIEVILAAIEAEKDKQSEAQDDAEFWRNLDVSDDAKKAAAWTKFDMVTVTEATRITGIAEQTLRAMCADGSIDGAERVGSKLWMVPREWAEARRTEEPGEGYVPLAEAARKSGVSREALLRAAQRGDIVSMSRKINERAKWYINVDDPSFSAYVARAREWAEKTKKQ